MVRDVIQDGYLIEPTVGRPQHFFEWSPRGKKEEVRQQARYLSFLVEEEEREWGTYVASHVGWLLYKQMGQFDKNFSFRFSRVEERDSFLFFSFHLYLYFFQIAMDEKLSWNSRGTKIVQLIISVLMDFQVTLFLSLSLLPTTTNSIFFSGWTAKSIFLPDWTLQDKLFTLATA